MKTILYALSIVLLLCTGCKKDNFDISADNALLTFSFKAESNPEIILSDITCDISDTVVIGVQGADKDRTALVAEFTTSGVVVLVNGVPQETGVTANDFTNPVTYTVMAADGSARVYIVKLKAFTAIPALYITTSAPVVSKEDYVAGTLRVDGNMEYTDGLYNGAIEIRGRGNSTWYQPKKPYKIKLGTKSKLLGMPADKEWALLANYYDKSLLRNKVGFEISSRVNMKYTPRSRFVEVFMNGEYLGNYLLCETIKVTADRLNIKEMDIKNPNDSTGGYLTQIDQRQDGAITWRTNRDVPFVMESFDVMPAANLQYVKNYIQRIEDKIYTYNYDPTTGYAAEFDLDRFIDWYLTNELMATNDAAFYSSVYAYKEKGGKLAMGPCWDMDLSSGNVNYGHVSPQGWTLNGSPWIFMMIRDANFNQKLKTRWKQIRTNVMSIPQYIDDQAKYLKYSQVENYTKWNILGTYIEPNQVVTGSYAGEVDYFKDWMQKRINWIDSQLNN